MVAENGSKKPKTGTVKLIGLTISKESRETPVARRVESRRVAGKRRGLYPAVGDSGLANDDDDDELHVTSNVARS